MASSAKTERPRRVGRRAAGRERIFEGLGVSPGVVIGPAYVSERGRVRVPEYTIPAGRVAAEQARFEHAVENALEQVRTLKAKAESLPKDAAEELGYLLDAGIQMLSGSRLVRGAAARIARDRINAEAAVQAEVGRIVEEFAKIDDAYLAGRIQDIRDVGDRLLRNLAEEPQPAFSRLPKGAIVIADELTPADTALFDPRVVAGFATVMGGAESHTAIMARSLGLPAVVGIEGLIRNIRTGDRVIIDGTGGRVIVHPTPETVARYRARRREIARENRDLARLRDLPAVTLDGVPIVLQANIELPREVDTALAVGAQGIGLLRSEFLFMNRDTPPDEEEQYEALSDIVRRMEGRPVTVRTLDVGGEKLAYSVGGFDGDAVNPALGLRAIRLSLQEQSLFETQLAAILRAARWGDLRILLPMISSVAEVRQVREVLKRVARRLVRQGRKVPDPLPPLGVMIEVPGAALAADALAQAADFFSIGTNDLTQYTLAIDRSDEQVAHLYNPLHPAVLRLIQFATMAGLKARIPICLCGEMAGDPRYTALLLGLGLRDLSMPGNSLPRIKQQVRRIDLGAATRRAELIMNQWDTGRIASLLDDFDAFG